MAEVGIKITGVEELQRKLAALPVKLRGKILRPLVREGANTVKEEAKRRVPVGAYRARTITLASGKKFKGRKHLRDTIKVRANPGKKRGAISLVISTGTREELDIHPNEKGYYPAALEYGGLAWQPIPYMRPAYRATRTKVTNTIRAKLLAAIEREASRK